MASPVVPYGNSVYTDVGDFCHQICRIKTVTGFS